MATLLISLVAVPGVLAAWPGLSRFRLDGVPVVWVVLGGAAYPALLLLAHHHRQAADRLEAALTQRDGLAGAPERR